MDPVSAAIPQNLRRIFVATLVGCIMVSSNHPSHATALYSCLYAECLPPLHDFLNNTPAGNCFVAAKCQQIGKSC